MNFNEILSKRRSIRKFKEENISNEKFSSTPSAPSHFIGLRPTPLGVAKTSQWLLKNQSITPRGGEGVGQGLKKKMYNSR